MFPFIAPSLVLPAASMAHSHWGEDAQNRHCVCVGGGGYTFELLYESDRDGERKEAAGDELCSSLTPLGGKNSVITSRPKNKDTSPFQTTQCASSAHTVADWTRWQSQRI